MRWIRPINARTGAPPGSIGAKAHGLVALHRLGLPVPAGFVVTTEACRAFMEQGRLPAGLREELTGAVAELEASTGRRFGADPPLTVSVRSGAAVSMPGMMDTVVNLGMTGEATAALAAETGEAYFAWETRLRFLAGFARALSVPVPEGAKAWPVPPEASEGGGGPERRDRGHPCREDLAAAVSALEERIGHRVGRAALDDPYEQLELAVAAVFASWSGPRAHTYRELNGIDHGLGTAVTVQAMVHGNLNDRSGTGVAFSRDPNTAAPGPYGDLLFARQGEDVVSGRALTLPLSDLRSREPGVWDALTRALDRLERHYRDACYVEFTFQDRALWLLQVRPGRFTGAAAVRLAVDLAEEGLIDRSEAVARVLPRHLRQASVPRLADPDRATVLARGLGAGPGVAVGRLATTTGAAIRMAEQGPVVLARPETSPEDMSGLAAAAGIVTSRGGAASHAAVVARSMGKPATVGAADLVVRPGAAAVGAGRRSVPEGTWVTVDGTGGLFVLGEPPVTDTASGGHLHRLLGWADRISGAGPGGGCGERADGGSGDGAGGGSDRDGAQRLRAAHEALRRA